MRGVSEATHAMATVAWSALRIGLAAYVGLCIVLFLRQSAMIYYPSRSMEDSPKRIGLAYEDVRLSTTDGETLGAWYVPATNPRGTILMCHGNGGNISHRVDAVKFFHDLGLDVLIFDYRGYGSSTGRPSEAGTYRDALAAWHYLAAERGVPAARLVVFGRSLGGAVAAWLAKQERPAGLVLEASFTSVPDLAAKLYPYLPVRLLCRFRYNTREYVRGARCPVLVAHSPDDDLIPFRHGRALFRAAPEPRIFVEISGGHNDGEVTFSDAYRLRLDAFLSSVLPASPRP